MLLASMPAIADNGCSTLLSDTIESKFSNFQGLKLALKAFAQDAKTPEPLKALVAKVFAGEDVEVVKLTGAIIRQYGLPADTNALAGKDLFKFRIVPRMGARSLNQEVTESIQQSDGGSGMDQVVKSHYVVLAQDKPLTRENNILIAIVHELAHIRIAKFLEAQIGHIYRRGLLPADLLKLGSDGVYEIDELLFSYLDERYAVEMELQALLATYPRYFDKLPEHWSPEVLNMSSEERSMRLSDYVCFTYKIRDPRIVQLRNHKISAILLQAF